MLTRNKSHPGSSLLSVGTNRQNYLPEKCRVCLDDGEIPIFGVNDISDDVTEFGKIEIGKDDKLPQHLCEACYTLLEAAILFRKTAKQSDEVLRRRVYSESDSEDSDCKHDETYIKREYLEFNYTSDSELDDFDRIKSESDDETRIKCDSDDETRIKRESDDETRIKCDSDDETRIKRESGDETRIKRKSDDETRVKREPDDETWIKRESDDETRIKRESDDETANYNPTFEADTHKNDCKDFQTGLLHVKSDEGRCINEAYNETIMIIVSNKDKQKLAQSGGGNSHMEFDNDEEKTECTEKSLMKILPHQKECEVCHRIVLKSSYRLHLKEHREKYKQKFNKRYGKIECEFCGKKISKSYLKHHLKMHGTAEEQAERVIKCSICDKMFSARYYNDHVRRVHEKESHKNKETIQNVKIRKEFTPPPIPKFNKCPVCDKKIKESEFKLHLERHGGPIKRYICDKCGKVFKHPSAFRTHCLTHGGELKYKCQFCPYRGLHQGLLKIHVRTHTGDYNYKCTECPARFITKSNLSKHLQRHKGLCTFICEECGKGFYTKRDVEKHTENVHMPAKNHVCEVCGKGFGHRDNMLSHQLKVHKRVKRTRGRMPSYLKAELGHLE